MNNAAPSRKLLVIANGLEVGGTERHLLQILPALKQRGIDVQLLLLRRGGALEAEMAAQGITIHGGPFRRLPMRPLMGFWHAVRLIRQWQPDIVHCFLPEAYLMGGLAACLLGVPVRVMSRRSLNDYQRKHPLAGWLERRLHRHMTALLGNSRAVVAQLAAEGMPTARIGLIYNGVALLAAKHGRAELRQAFGLAPEALVFVLVANLIPYKGHADLIEAMAKAAPGLPPDTRVVCIGRDDGHGGALRLLAKLHGVAERFLWLGQLADHAQVASLLAAADAGLLVSHEEGFSNAVLEGMAAGLPMLVTDVGGNAEAIGESGLVVPPRDPAALAGGLIALADPARRLALGAKAAERAARHFSPAAMIDRYVSFYNDLVQKGAAGQS
ncbi:glycosyltransferase [Ferrovibrio sp.]|uniref:glycosyltransferase n=1 Tax=Ferrovibrio sp. TaxID=1917215 RepID=UPI003D2660A5